MTYEDRRNIMKSKKEKRFKKYDEYWLIGTCLQYVDSDATLFKLLLLNKKSH